MVGSLFAFFVFREAGHLFERYGHYVRVPEEDIERGRRWFRRWGESSVLWGRFLPVLRTVISVPAGLAEMDTRKFAVYSGVGTGLFAAGVAVLVVAGRRVLPTEYLLARTTGALDPTLGYLQTNPAVALAVLAVALLVAVVGQRLYRRIDRS